MRRGLMIAMFMEVALLIWVTAVAPVFAEDRPVNPQRDAALAELASSASGCDLAMMGALPGSDSQRNAERHGFHIAYTRIKWRRTQPEEEA